MTTEGVGLDVCLTFLRPWPGCGLLAEQQRRAEHERSHCLGFDVPGGGADDAAADTDCVHMVAEACRTQRAYAVEVFVAGMEVLLACTSTETDVILVVPSLERFDQD